MVNYPKEIEKLMKQFGFPEMGEAFEGHPDDSTVLEEYYLYDVPRNPYALKSFKSQIAQIINGAHEWELDTNVLTVYK